MDEQPFDWSRLLIGVCLVAIFTLGIHGEIVAGHFIGLGVFSFALPFAIDAYVLAAFWAKCDVPAAMLVLAVSIGGGHFLIGLDVAESDGGSLTKGVVGATAAVLLVTVLWRVHVLTEKLAEKRTESARKKLEADEKRRSDRRREADEDAARRRIIAEAEAAAAQARVDEARQIADIEMRQDEARRAAEIDHAERLAKIHPVKQSTPVGKPNPIPSRPVPDQRSSQDREDVIKAVMDGRLSKDEAALKIGKSTKTIERAIAKARQAGAEVVA